jgi:hypothetical protein
MPKTLSKTDPALLAGVKRLQRVQQVWGVLLVGLGLFTEMAATSEHPVAGLPFIAVGLLAFRLAEPALLATVGTLMAFSIVPTINPRLTILGPDPVLILGAPSFLELLAIVVGKAIIVLTVANQFFLYRFLYGTSRASTEDPSQAIIPEMVPNRTNGLARWARWIAIAALIFALGSLLLRFVDPDPFIPRLWAEIGGSLATIAVGFGLGAAFSPTDLRRAALWGVSAGATAYVVASLVLLALPA